MSLIFLSQIIMMTIIITALIDSNKGCDGVALILMIGKIMVTII